MVFEIISFLGTISTIGILVLNRPIEYLLPIRTQQKMLKLI